MFDVEFSATLVLLVVMPLSIIKFPFPSSFVIPCCPLSSSPKSSIIQDKTQSPHMGITTSRILHTSFPVCVSLRLFLFRDQCQISVRGVLPLGFGFPFDFPVNLMFILPRRRPTYIFWLPLLILGITCLSFSSYRGSTRW